MKAVASHLTCDNVVTGRMAHVLRDLCRDIAVQSRSVGACL